MSAEYEGWQPSAIQAVVENVRRLEARIAELEAQLAEEQRRHAVTQEWLDRFHEALHKGMVDSL